MTAQIEKFIRDALKGGWVPSQIRWQMTFSCEWRDTVFGQRLWCYDDVSEGAWLNEYSVWIDPLAWRAVGIVRDWTNDSQESFTKENQTIGQWEKNHWGTHMENFMRAMRVHVTPEEYLKSIE